MPFVVEPLVNHRRAYIPAISLPTVPGSGALPKMEVSNLLPGDVLVWYLHGTEDGTKDQRIHGAIRKYGRGAYSHVEVHVGDGWSIGAGLTGVYKEMTSDIQADFELGTVVRWDDDNEERRMQRVEAAIGYLQTQVGHRRYSKLDAALLPVRRWGVRLKSDQSSSMVKRAAGRLAIYLRKRWGGQKSYCSQLVVEAYAKAGIFHQHHLDEAAFSPNDFLTEPNFIPVGFLTDLPDPKYHPLDVNLQKTAVTSHIW